MLERFGVNSNTGLMIHHQQSSGNFVADKRAQDALHCVETNDFAETVEGTMQALELEPLWVSCLMYFAQSNRKYDCYAT